MRPWRILGLWWALLVRAMLPVQAQTPACPPPVEALSAAALAEQPAKDLGMLWRLQRAGLTSYLYGSMHLGRPDWARPGPALERALQAAEVLALEIDSSDAQTQASLQARERTEQPALPPSLQARLQAQIDAACLPPQALARLHPMLQLSSLTLLAARWDGLDMAFGQEAMLTRLAQARGLPIVGLEQVQDQLQALIPQDRSSLLRSLDVGLQQLEQGRVRAAMLRLATAWERGRLQELQDYEQWCECVSSDADRAWLRRLNDGRNPQLAAGIAALHGQGRRVLAVVGALHMSGPQALPKLLQAQGFSVEQVHPAPEPNEPKLWHTEQLQVRETH